MLYAWLNWRTLLAALAIVVVTATIFYSRYLAGRISEDERKKVEAWAWAQQYIAKAQPDQDILFASLLVAEQTTIPVIETNEQDSITNLHNIDTSGFVLGVRDVMAILGEYKAMHPPIITYLNSQQTRFNKYYYGESSLLRQVRYYPMLQLAIVALFIVVTLLSMIARHRAENERLWSGMARETAHQLGTPLTALEGWIAMMKESPADPTIPEEMGKDLLRLKRVSERFSRIGNAPKLEPDSVVDVILQVVDYIRKRAPNRVTITVDADPKTPLRVMMSPPLFEWVIENLLRNALDAMDGVGEVRIKIMKEEGNVVVDITDTGKGIAAGDVERIFRPGFTSKKRGWGLGLTLSRRIIHQYHGGRLWVLNSEPGKGTCFRILMKSL